MAETLQQKERVERKHHQILNMARALQFQVNLLVKFWDEYVLIAGYLINRTPSPVICDKSPYELLHGKITPFLTYRCLVA